MRSAVHDFWEQMTNAADLGHHLPVDADRPFRLQMRILAIRRPAAGESQWEIEYSATSTDEPGDRQYKLRCDAAADRCVVSDDNQLAGEHNVSQHQLGTIFGRVTTIDTKIESKNEDGEWKTQLRLREMDDAESQQCRLTWKTSPAGHRSGLVRVVGPPALAGDRLAVVGLILAGVGNSTRCRDRPVQGPIIEALSYFISNR